jgi:hypothetical protein
VRAKVPIMAFRDEFISAFVERCIDGQVDIFEDYQGERVLRVLSDMGAVVLMPVKAEDVPVLTTTVFIDRTVRVDPGGLVDYSAGSEAHRFRDDATVYVNVLEAGVMRGAHLRPSAWRYYLEGAIFVLALCLFGAGLVLGVEALHDKRAESITSASSTTTIPMILGDPVVATTMATTPAENPRLLTAGSQKRTVSVPTTQIGTALSIVRESTTTTTVRVPKTPLEVAQAEVGKAGSYADGGFWCAKFISWVAGQAHVGGFEQSDSPARLYAVAKEEGRLTDTPQPGYLVFIDLTGESFANEYVSHVGIVESVDGDTIRTIEGNADDSGVVTRQQRQIGDGYVIDFAPFTA